MNHRQISARSCRGVVYSSMTMTTTTKRIVVPCCCGITTMMVLLLILLLSALTTVTAFQRSPPRNIFGQGCAMVDAQQSRSSSANAAAATATINQLQQTDSDFDRPSTSLENDSDKVDNDGDFDDEMDINVVWINDDDDQEDEEKDAPAPLSSEKKGKSGKDRWEQLNPKVKQRLIEKGQAKAIANKKKREPADAKKRRMLLEFKRLQQEKKMASRVERPLPFDQRAPLTAYFPGMKVTGVVISLTAYGAYVDVGTECDGLLHVSQLTRDFFVEHPRQILSPGDEVTVKIRSASPELKKMQLTMLDDETLAEEMAAVKSGSDNDDDSVDDDRIPLTDVEIDDELWGEMKRVTDFGAYVEVGAEVDGFLHFMDHPDWEDGMHPSEFMKKGQRVRVWVADRNLQNRRIRLTANRPQGLPGPRFEM